MDADLLQSEEYLLARKGESAVALVRELTADLAAIRNGDRKFLSYAARARAEARIPDALAKVRR